MPTAFLDDERLFGDYEWDGEPYTVRITPEEHAALVAAKKRSRPDPGEINRLRRYIRAHQARNLL